MAETQVTRPGLGKAGTRVEVTVNAFKVTVPSLVVHHYDIAVKGQVGRGGTLGDVPPIYGKEIFHHLRFKLKAFGEAPVVHDGRKNMFSVEAFKWPNHKKVFKVDLSDNPPKSGGASKGSKPGNSNKDSKDKEGDKKDENGLKVDEDGNYTFDGPVGRKVFMVTISKVGEANLDALSNYVNGRLGRTADEFVSTAITALNIICNHDLTATSTSAKNKVFPEPPPLPQGARQSDRILALRGGIDVWRGYFSSIRLAPQCIILNFDLTSQPMIKPGDLHNVAAEIAGLRGGPREIAGLRGPAVINLTRILKTITVTVTKSDGTKLKCKIKEVAGNARSRTFEAPEHANSTKMRKWTVLEYMETNYNRRLSFPDLPLVRLTSRAWYPMELCKIEPGHKFTKKMSPEQVADSIRWLTVKPQERTQMLAQGVSQHLASSPSLTKWGLSIRPTPLKLEARKLSQPTVNLGRRAPDGKIIPAPTSIANGQWNLKGNSFFRPVHIKLAVSFAFLSDNPRNRVRFGPQEADIALKGLANAFQNCGITFTTMSSCVFGGRDGPTNVPGQDGFSNWIKVKSGSKPSLIICFLQDKNAWQYRQLKVFGDAVTGVATQCMSIEKVLKGNPQYFANVALKINAKISGINHTVGGGHGVLFKLKDTMLMGADVTHPVMGSGEPSVAAVVASSTEYGVGYAAEFSAQPGRQEIIEDLEGMTKELLLKYHKRNNRLPAKVIFYRDGVSEGQFAHVLQREIPLLRRAFKDLGEKLTKGGPPEAIKLTFIVCGKRHHFKFGPANPNKDGDRTGNLLPGIIVDSGVTHPFDFDWYGLSHSGLLGTSRPAHYTVLVDDNKFKADEIQGLTYLLCYLYSRSTRSVSIATPAYYAHHVCSRAKLLIGNFDHEGSNATPTPAEIERLLGHYRNRVRELKVQFNQSANANGKDWFPEYWM